MDSDWCYSGIGDSKFDLVIRDVQIVNVFSACVEDGDIAVRDGDIVYVGKMDFDYQAGKTIEGKHRFAVPGFIDSHMHIESSMMTPAHFAEMVLPCGTTSIAPDPHEIGNVFGVEGVRAFAESAAGLPLHVFMAAPSTIPSSPGYERSGFFMEPEDMEELLDLPGVTAMGEMMDFNGVAGGDERLLNIIRAARKRGALLDGHISILSGKKLQNFVMTGVDSDHTVSDPRTAEEKLRLGVAIQVQKQFYTEEFMKFLNDYPVQNRIMLVTDDVPFIRIVREGHLNASVREAIRLGLDPLKAVRYVTINAADRMRLYDRGAIAPGRRADIVLMPDLTEIRPDLVISDGEVVAENGRCTVSLPEYHYPERFFHSIHVHPVEAKDFAIRMPADRMSDTSAELNVIRSDARTSRTKRVIRTLPVRDGIVDYTGWMKMAVFYRHGYKETPDGELLAVAEYRHRYGKEAFLANEVTHKGREISLGLLEGIDGFCGAFGVTYAHDSHNLTIYGSNDEDMAIAANHLIECGGGLCAVQGGRLLACVELPVGGILSEKSMTQLAPEMIALQEAIEQMQLTHKDPMSFLSLMALAVSPEIKCTDSGLVDVVNKRFLPLIEEKKEEKTEERIGVNTHET